MKGDYSSSNLIPSQAVKKSKEPFWWNFMYFQPFFMHLSMLTPWGGGGGGGSAGNGWGFDQEVKMFANFPRVGRLRSSNVVKNLHPWAHLTNLI